MNTSIRQWLRDTLRAAELIHREAHRQDLDSLSSNDWFRGAVERQFEIIGEALNRIRRADPSYAESIPAVHEWIALRNVVAHLYDLVDVEILRHTIETDIPTLINALRMLLANDDTSDAGDSVERIAPEDALD